MASKEEDAVPARPVKPSGRLGSRKSKRGCITCKTRRVRCGEERPFCRRCTIAGFRCRGYADPFVTSQISTTYQEELALTLRPTKVPSSVPDFNLAEQRSFELCRTHLIPHLGGALEFGFWESLVLQMSVSEPSVRQSLVALGSMFEQSRATQYRAQELNDNTLKAYNNALAVTSKRTQAPDGEVVALITCVLFLCIEFMQGNKHRALNLLRHGQTVLRRYLERQFAVSGRANDFIMTDTIIPLYERLSALSALHGRLLPPLNSGGPAITADPILSRTSFQSVNEASKLLYPLCIEGNKFIKKTRSYCRAATEATISHIDDQSLEGRALGSDVERTQQETMGHETESPLLVWTMEQAALLQALERWLEMVLKLSATPAAGSVRDQQLKRILMMWHTTATIRVKSSLHASESSFDEYLSLFTIIVENAEAFQAVTASRPGIGDFTFEMGVLPPLFFTALKCRYPGIRRRAIAAMRMSPRKEGLWDREELLIVSQKIVDLEQNSLSNTADDTEPVQPRVCDVRLAPSTEEDNTHVTLLMIDEKPDLGWTVSEALLHLQEDL